MKPSTRAITRAATVTSQVTAQALGKHRYVRLQKVKLHRHARKFDQRWGGRLFALGLDGRGARSREVAVPHEVGAHVLFDVRVDCAVLEHLPDAKVELGHKTRTLVSHQAIDAYVVGGLGTVEQAEYQTLVSIAHGLALGTIAQVGVDTAGKHLLQALVAAVVRVHVGIRASPW